MGAKVVVALLVALAFLLPPLGPGASQPAGAGQKKWTVMVYMSADNNLEPDGIHDFNEMESVGSSDEVNIVVQFDRTPAYDASNENWTGTRRYYITKDSDMTTISSKMMVDLGEANMGDPATLSNYTTWAVDKYPAERYLVVFWDHGGAWHGVCWDDTDQDYLDMDNVSAALKSLRDRLGRPVDLLGFDACLMAGIEILYQIRGLCDFAATSGTTEPNEGWPYDWILPALVLKPEMTPRELAVEITNDYVDSYTDGKDDPADTVLATMSAWEMSRVPYLFDLWNQLSMRLATKALTYNAYIREVRAVTQGYDPAHVVFLDITNYPLYDIYDFCNHFLRPMGGPFLGFVLDAGLRANIEAVQNQFMASRVAERHGPRYPDGFGLTVYFPSGNNSAASGTPKTQYDARYNNIDFARDMYWDEFLQAYLGLTNVANTPPYATILSPADGATLSADDGRVLVTGTSFDTAAVMEVKVRIDNGSWRKVEGIVNWQYRWDISSLKGTHTISAFASDGTYDSPVVSRTFDIQPTTNLSARPGFAWAVGAGVAALAAVAMAGGWAWRRGALGKISGRLKPEKKNSG